MGEYVFQEFPKWVCKPSGEPVIVYSIDEERLITSGQSEPPVVEVAPEPVAQDENKLIKRRGRPTNAEIAARKAAEQGA